MAQEKHGGPLLRRWLDENELTQYWLADQIGRTPQYISKVIGGVIEPSLHKAFEIERITKGAVQAQTLIRPENKFARAA